MSYRGFSPDDMDANMQALIARPSQGPPPPRVLMMDEIAGV
jgi:dienelactone hydrolase